MKQVLVASVLDDSQFGIWNELVAGSPAGSVYSDTEYLEVLCKATGGSFRILGVHRGGELIGGIAIYVERSRSALVLSNRLLLYYNGIVLATPKSQYPSERTSQELAVLSAIESKLSQARYDRTVIHNRDPLSDVRAFTSKGWNAKPSYSYVMTFTDLDASWARIEQNLRRLIKRCEATGAVFMEDDDFDSFYRLHLETHQRKGAPLYLPARAFRSYFENLRALGLCKLFHVRTLQGQAMASQLVLTSKHQVTHTVCAAADKSFLSQGASPFLRWSVCRFLAATGYAATDLTDASLNDVTHFKSQLGGQLVTNLVLTKPDSICYRVTRRIWHVSSKGASLLKRLTRIGRIEAQER